MHISEGQNGLDEEREALLDRIYVLYRELLRATGRGELGDIFELHDDHGNTLTVAQLQSILESFEPMRKRGRGAWKDFPRVACREGRVFRGMQLTEIEWSNLQSYLIDIFPPKLSQRLTHAHHMVPGIVVRYAQKLSGIFTRSRR